MLFNKLNSGTCERDVTNCELVDGERSQFYYVTYPFYTCTKLQNELLAILIKYSHIKIAK